MRKSGLLDFAPLFLKVEKWKIRFCSTFKKSGKGFKKNILNKYTKENVQ